MNLTQLKNFFRTKFKVVAGGPATGPGGITRAEGVLSALDALADFAAGNAAAGYSDAQARAAQLNRTAAAGTTTVTLTAEAPSDYGTAASGTFTVDANGCAVGKVVRFALSAGASAPGFANAPAGQPFKFLGAAYATGQAFSYSLLVCVDRIEVVVLTD